MRPRLLVPDAFATARLAIAMFSLAAAGFAQAAPVTVPASYQVEIETICRTGLVAWLPVSPGKDCGQVQTPQVKIFGKDGHLRFTGNVKDAVSWIDAWMPVRPMPRTVLVREWTSEARTTGMPPARPDAPVVVYYVGGMCPPCIPQFETIKERVLPALGPRAEVRVVRIGEVFPER